MHMISTGIVYRTISAFSFLNLNYRTICTKKTSLQKYTGAETIRPATGNILLAYLCSFRENVILFYTTIAQKHIPRDCSTPRICLTVLVA